MTPQPDFWTLLVAMTLAAFFCRAAGFWLMRYVPITPRIEAALRATPLAVMVGIVAPSALSGRPAEMLALVVTVGLRRLTGSDLIAAFGGVAVIAAFRALQQA